MHTKCLYTDHCSWVLAWSNQHSQRKQILHAYESQSNSDSASRPGQTAPSQAGIQVW